ncbi:hypothetical protein Hypma_005018 [Hypsizygus marmoreus]|uniref:F-box domain-containing protein n=1 Tax=Hypsizygus marmoreus TaxID=39966 RepID=A0A369JXL0_HYPMA|nr:hypothetical protein Hypma_005018 [Hypsizygus marmoreus]
MYINIPKRKFEGYTPVPTFSSTSADIQLFIFLLSPRLCNMFTFFSSVTPNVSHEAFIGALAALSIWTIARYFVTRAFDSAQRLRSSAWHSHYNGPQDGPRSTPGDDSAPVRVIENIRRPKLSEESLPQIVMTGGLDSISITVGDKSSLSANTTSMAQLEYLRGGLRGWPIKIHADHSYGIDQFLLVAQHLDLLAETVIPDRWAEISIYFPVIPLQHPYTGSMFEPPYLKRLSWTGHREQLINSWLPLTGKTLYHLTHLTLHSDISIRDFERLLLASPSLAHFELSRVADVDSVLDLPHSTTANKHELQCLQFLSISAVTDIFPLLHNFIFPQLRRIDLVLYSRNPHPQDFPWNQCKKLEFVKITARHMKPADSRRVEAQCPSNTKHSHWLECTGRSVTEQEGHADNPAFVTLL